MADATCCAAMVVRRASVEVLRIYDVAESIDLARVEKLLAGSGPVARIRLERVQPKAIAFGDPPVVTDLLSPVLEVDGARCAARASARIHGFGVMSLALDVELPRPLPWPEERVETITAGDRRSRSCELIPHSHAGRGLHPTRASGFTRRPAARDRVAWGGRKAAPEPSGARPVAVQPAEGAMMTQAQTREVRIPAGGAVLDGTLTVPPDARGVVLFAHGSGSSRFSPRNRQVAAELQADGFATVLLDLLTRAEERVDEVTLQHRFDIGLLAGRLVHAVEWLAREPATRALPIGCFGASTGAAAALVAAAERPGQVRAVVSRGGRPDLAVAALQRVRAPTLLIVGGRDASVLVLNEDAMRRMVHAKVRLRVVAGATHLFEEPGALEQVAAMACDWFRGELAAAPEPVAAGAPG